MTTELSAHLQLVIDEVCLLGCQQVNTIITQLQHDNAVENLPSLSKEERGVVLNELQTIMAIYDKK